MPGDDFPAGLKTMTTAMQTDGWREVMALKDDGRRLSLPFEMKKLGGGLGADRAMARLCYGYG